MLPTFPASGTNVWAGATAPAARAHRAVGDSADGIDAEPVVVEADAHRDDSDRVEHRATEHTTEADAA